MKFLMLARPGERHEDCIPEGLFTLEGFRKHIESEKERCESEYEKNNGSWSEGFEYYIFVMEPDAQPSWKYDCNHTIGYFIPSSEEKDDHNVNLGGYEFDQIHGKTMDDIILILNKELE